MPIIKKIELSSGTLGIWELSEELQDLIRDFQFSEIEKSEYDKIRNEKRKKEYLATRILLEELINIKPDIGYKKTGKPFLKNHDLNVSISHSFDLVTVYISKNKIGVDVENTQRNVDKIANRFLHEKEMNHILQKDHQQIAKILYWSAKEAVFKCTDLDGIQFNDQIFVSPFNIEDSGCFQACLNNTVFYKLWYFFYKNNVIVYCVEE